MRSSSFWKGRNVLVTGGASFIGSHLVDKLVELEAFTRIADDLSSGRLENLEYPWKFDKDRGCWKSKGMEFFKGDLKDRCFTEKVMEDMDRVFHLAALHGGRG
ncbi:MAG: GDP-mannose 4,6-dehydratase, partial [Candidatus Hodarchaeota archaeon]